MHAEKASSFLAVSQKLNNYIRPRCLFYQVSISVLVGLYGICKGYRGLKVIYGFKEKCYACRNILKLFRCIAETEQLYSTSMPILCLFWLPDKGSDMQSAMLFTTTIA